MASEQKQTPGNEGNPPTKKAKTQEAEGVAEAVLLSWWNARQTDSKLIDWLKQCRDSNPHLDDDTWQQIVDGHFPGPGDSSDACVFARGYSCAGELNSPTKAPRKQFRVGKDGKQVMILLNRLAALTGKDGNLEQDQRAEERMVREDGSLRSGWHASHWWCHSNACVNPRHVRPESHKVNQERNTCRSHTNTSNFRCPHRPCCKNCNSCFVTTK